MSLSVDDLVSSLNASHIGQEAIDLAALQVQLAATLFPARNSRSSSHQHCNTPLARTPSNSISMSIDMTMRTSGNSRRGSYSTPHHHHNHSLSRNDSATSPSAYYYHSSSFDDTMEEDERMVEELLLPPPNSASSMTPSTPISPSFHNATTTTLSNTASPSFTTADPFYLSQLQASQQPFAPNPATSQSVFAQNGRMTQGSRFARQPLF